ncbi:MAG: DUF4276 family protein [Deltaproteobacteria bacterium]|nr:DUF4276 family protein [Deltaproteobacteria bacterium]
MNLGLVVEGHGEVEAVPILVRRIAAWAGFEEPIVIPAPLRVHRSSIVKEGELERAVELTARKVGEGGPILIVLDADDDASCELAPALLERAKRARSDRGIGVVIAVHEFEAWFLAAAESLRGARSLPSDLTAPVEPEGIKSPKAWLDARMVDGYSETLEQPKLAARFDIDTARTAYSFDKLVREVCRLLAIEPPARRGQQAEADS